jgi:hypothetical protein
MRAGGAAGGAAAGGADARRAAREAAARAALQEWISAVLQPSPAAWGGWGVARPSAFCEGGPDFLAQCAAVMADRGGAGSWLWAKLPPGAVTQGAARGAGGAARERAGGAAAAADAEAARAAGRAARAVGRAEREKAERAAASREARERRLQRAKAARAALREELAPPPRAAGGAAWEDLFARAAGR